MSKNTPCHIALPCYDLEKARSFYTEILGQKEMRSASNWVDFDFYGHQLTLHLVRGKLERPESQLIDGDLIPVAHCGAILSREDWEALRERLSSHEQIFVIGPRLRFATKDGEQWTFFTKDPTGNFLEFKYFTDTSKGPWY